MASQEFDAIHARLEKLERRLRVTLVGWVLSLVVLVLLGATAQRAISQPTVLRARSLEIVDQTGQARIVLSVDRIPGRSDVRPGVSGIWLLDAAGKPRARLSSADDGSFSLSFSDPARPQFSTLSLDGFILSDTTGKGRIQLIPDGLSLWDTGRRMRILLAIDADGGAGLTLFDGAGKPRAALDVEQGGSPGLTLFDGVGQTVFKTP